MNSFVYVYWLITVVATAVVMYYIAHRSGFTAGEVAGSRKETERSWIALGGREYQGPDDLFCGLLEERKQRQDTVALLHAEREKSAKLRRFLVLAILEAWPEEKCFKVPEDVRPNAYDVVHEPRAQYVRLDQKVPPVEEEIL